MKNKFIRLIYLITLAVVTTGILTSCSNSTSTLTTTTMASISTTESQTETQIQTETETEVQTLSKTESTEAPQVQTIDLSALSRTMVFAQIYNMVMVPDEYIGKIIKIKGRYYRYESDFGEFDSVVITDETACCEQGMDFVLKDSSVELPENGSDIVVSGIFQEYNIGKYTFFRLNEAWLDN